MFSIYGGGLNVRYYYLLFMLLNRGHKYGPVTDNMDIVKTHKKGKHTKTPEKYHTRKLYGNNL
jgi:hypothetical protein